MQTYSTKNFEYQPIFSAAILNIKICMSFKQSINYPVIQSLELSLIQCCPAEHWNTQKDK